MNVLFLHSGDMVTGSVTYARALELAWRGKHRVYWTGDVLPARERRGIVLRLARRLVPYGIGNAMLLAQFVREKQIDILHSHSRRANLIAAMVSRATGIPYIVTAHMRTRPHYGNRLWPCWGMATIAICETIAEHLRERNSLPPERIELIRNGIDLTRFQPDEQRDARPSIRWITVLGRLSGKRWKAAEFILQLVPELARISDDVRVRFIGAVTRDHEQELSRWLHKLNAQRQVVEWMGFKDDPALLLRESALVIAAGRSLMESMASGVPVIAVGENASIGLIDESSYARARRSNFGDFPAAGEEGFDKANVLPAASALLADENYRRSLGQWSREQVSRDYDLVKVAAAIEALYKRHLRQSPARSAESPASAASLSG